MKRIMELPADSFLCGVCRSELKEPRTLMCGHVFCLSCLVPIKLQGRNLHCPLCRKSTKLPPNMEVRDIGESVVVKNLQKHVEEQQTKAQRSGVCAGGCSSDPPPKLTHFCHQCREKYCEACIQKHQTHPLLKQHDLERIEKLIFCACHSSELVSIFCQTCAKKICNKCVVGFHGNHETESLEKAVRAIKAEIQSVLSRKDDIKIDKTRVTKLKKTADSMAEDTSKAISSVRKEVRQFQSRLTSLKATNKRDVAEMRTKIISVSEESERQLSVVKKLEKVDQEDIGEAGELLLEGVFRKLPGIPLILPELGTVLNDFASFLTATAESLESRMTSLTKWLPNGDAKSFNIVCDVTRKSKSGPPEGVTKAKSSKPRKRKADSGKDATELAIPESSLTVTKITKVHHDAVDDVIVTSQLNNLSGETENAFPEPPNDGGAEDDVIVTSHVKLKFGFQVNEEVCESFCLDEENECIVIRTKHKENFLLFCSYIAQDDGTAFMSMCEYKHVIAPDVIINNFKGICNDTKRELFVCPIQKGSTPCLLLLNLDGDSIQPIPGMGDDPHVHDVCYSSSGDYYVMMKRPGRFTLISAESYDQLKVLNVGSTPDMFISMGVNQGVCYFTVLTKNRCNIFDIEGKLNHKEVLRPAACAAEDEGEIPQLVVVSVKGEAYAMSLLPSQVRLMRMRASSEEMGAEVCPDLARFTFSQMGRILEARFDHTNSYLFLRVTDKSANREKICMFQCEVSP